MDDPGQKRDDIMRRGMVEPDRPADQVRPRAAASVAKNRVAIVHVLVRERLDTSCGYSRLAPEAMSPSVRHEGKVALLEHAVLGPLDREPAAAARHCVKAQASLERRELERPGSGELGAAIEHSGHP